MQTVLVMRQLTAVLDELLLWVTRSVKLTPHDVLVLAWMAAKPGIAGNDIAHCIGRSRQNVQRSLERLEERGLAERWQSNVRDRAGGWALTQRGTDMWTHLEQAFRKQDEMLERKGLMTRPFLEGLQNMITGLMSASRGMATIGLMEVPSVEAPPPWDV